jgi:hypothetical protein
MYPKLASNSESSSLSLPSPGMTDVYTTPSWKCTLIETVFHPHKLPLPHRFFLCPHLTVEDTESQGG